MTNKEKVIAAMRYLKIDHIYTEYDYELSVMGGRAKKIFPKHIIRDKMHFSFYLPESRVNENRLVYHGYNGFSNMVRDTIWVYIEDDDICEELFDSILPELADRCLLKAKRKARRKLMKNIISAEIADADLDFFLPGVKWDKLLKDE